MLLLCLVTLLGVQGALSQVIRLGSCQRYVGDGNFDLSYIQSLVDHPDGFFIGVTSGPLNRRCQKIKFEDNGTYTYTYFDSNSVKQEYTGAYTADPTTFTNLGTIKLEGLGLGQLGASLRGTVTLQVIIAERTRLLLSSCMPFGVANTAQVHALIPTRHYTGTSGLELVHSLKVGEFPDYATLKMTPQLCNNPEDDAEVTSRTQAAVTQALLQGRPAPTIKLVVSQHESNRISDTNARSSVNSIDLGITAHPEEPNQVVLQTVGSFPVQTELGEITATRVEDLAGLSLFDKTLATQDDQTLAEKGFKIVDQRRQSIGSQTPNGLHHITLLQALIPEGGKLNNGLLDANTRMLLSNYILAQSDPSARSLNEDIPPVLVYPESSNVYEQLYAKA